MTGLVPPADVRAAAQALQGVAIRTPLLPAPWLDEETGAEVRLKCENLQRGGAFKIRGAYTALARLDPAARARGVITYSSGNHGRAVALTARLFGVPATIVMPTTAPAVKVEAARALGARVVLEGTTSLERQRRAEEIAAKEGLTIVPPFDHPDIIAGQGTAALEILEDWPELDAVLVPVGGGGLLAGTATWVRHARPGCTIVGVEPEHANAMQESLRAGHPVTIPARPTIADGLAPVRPGELTFLHARALVDEIVTVSDEAIARATAALLQHARLVVEFSGAAAVAALLDGRWRPRGHRRIAAILSGGNLDPARALQLLTAPR